MEGSLGSEVILHLGLKAWPRCLLPLPPLLCHLLELQSHLTEPCDNL